MSTNHPKLKLVLDPQIDKQFFDIFANAKRAIRPEMLFLFQDEFKSSRQKVLSAYVDCVYEYNKKDYRREWQRIKKEWHGLERYFFQQTDKLFNGWPWPTGDYIGYSSIWYMFPRFINDKTFCLPIFGYASKTKRLVSSVIAHEMLHFITYDYLEKKFNLKPSEAGDKDNLFWRFTEDLNVLIENEKIWQPFSKGVISKSYTADVKLYPRMKKIWQGDKSIDNLVKRILM